MQATLRRWDPPLMHAGQPCGRFDTTRQPHVPRIAWRASHVLRVMLWLRQATCWATSKLRSREARPRAASRQWPFQQLQLQLQLQLQSSWMLVYRHWVDLERPRKAVH